ncbi:MAG: hypothetical protein AB7O88_27160 [Reyranellaceae bacterium]
MRIRLVAASLAVSLLSLPAMAQDKVGIAACDDFLEKYEACVTKMPAASQQAVKDSIVQMRTSWKAAAGDPNSKAALESACKSSAASMNQSMSAYGCKF